MASLFDQTDGDLPEAFAMRNDDGSIEQIKDPCYNLLSPGYYGDTWYDTDEIIRTGICPNYEMQPLNRAAGENMRKWLASLPEDGVQLSMEDTVEAAMMLRNNADVDKMSHEEASNYVRKLAMKIKAKRDTAQGLTLPPVSMNEARRAGNRNAPAMANARFTDPTVRQSGRQAVIHEPVHGPITVKRAKAAIANLPPSAGR